MTPQEHCSPSLVSLLGRGRRLWMNHHLYWCHLKETPNTSKLYNCPILNGIRVLESKLEWKFNNFRFKYSLWRCPVSDPAEIFLTSKFELLLSNPTQKSKTRTANRWETTNCNLCGPTKRSSQLETGISPRMPFDCIY